LPAVADAESLQVRCCRLASRARIGLANRHQPLLSRDGRFIPFDHKTVLSIAPSRDRGVLLAHYSVGLRGRRAARLALLAWLLLTLAYLE